MITGFYSFSMGLLVAALLGLGFYFLISAVRARGEWRAQKIALFLVSSLEDDATAQVETCEKLIRSLGALKRTFALEAVVPHVGDRIHFYVAVARAHERQARRELHRLFGGFAVERIHDDHIVFVPHGAVAAAMFTQKESAAIPIPLYREIGADLFKDVLRGLAQVSQIGEGAAVQFIVKPAENVPLPSGKKFKDVLCGVNIRAVASAGSEFRARDILDGILAGFEKFKWPGKNALRAIKPRATHALINQFLIRDFDEGQKVLLTGAELASVYHIGRVLGVEELA
jgi:hypothetical protein